MVIHYGQCADGWESYSDTVDALDCETTLYERLLVDDAAAVLSLAQARAERFGTGYTVQVGDLFAESECA